MTLDSIQKLLLIQSLESCDSSGLLLSFERRRQATLDSGIQPVSGKLGALQERDLRCLIERANRLHEFLSQESPFKHLLAIQAPVPKLKGLGILTIIVAFLLGLLSNQLGNHQFINLVAFPLLGLFLWNLMMYGLFLGKWIKDKLHPSTESTEFFGLLTHLLHQLHQLFQNRLLRFSNPVSSEETQQLIFQIRTQFLTKWMKLTTPIQLVKITIVLHLGAAAMAVGVIGGMYFNGVSFEYKAGWESTFLTAGALQKGLEIVLGPASMLSRIEIPPGKPLTALRWPDSTGENAALWIHLFAMATLLYIVFPRIILSVFAYQRIRTMQMSLTLSEDTLPYYQELSLQVNDFQPFITVLPYCMTLETQNQELLKQLLHRLWRQAGEVKFQDPIPYGKTVNLLESNTTLPAYLVVVLDFNATPEKEAHGGVVQAIKRQFLNNSGPTRLLILLDCHRFEKIRTLPEFEKRFQERQNAWKTMFHEIDLPCFIFDTMHTKDIGEHLQRAAEAVWEK